MCSNTLRTNPSPDGWRAILQSSDGRTLHAGRQGYPTAGEAVLALMQETPGWFNLLAIEIGPTDAAPPARARSGTGFDQ